MMAELDSWKCLKYLEVLFVIGVKGARAIPITCACLGSDMLKKEQGPQ